MKTLIIFTLAFTLSSCSSKNPVLITPDNPNIAYIGRFDLSDSHKSAFMYSGCAIRTRFTGTSVEMLMKVQNYIHSIVNESAKTDSNVHYFGFTPFEMHGSDWHPNVTEHTKMANELTPFIRNLMKW